MPDITKISQQDAKYASKLEALLESAVDAIITISAQGLIETVNPAAERLFQYSSEELIGQNVKFLMPEPYRSEHDGYLRHFRHSPIWKAASVHGRKQACLTM